MVLNFGPGHILVLSIACFITFCVRKDCNKNNNINVLFIVCIADLYQVEIVDKF